MNQKISVSSVSELVELTNFSGTGNDRANNEPKIGPDRELNKIDRSLKELYGLKRDTGIWNEETSKLLSKAIFYLESVEESLIHNRAELKQRLRLEITAHQIYAVFARSSDDREEISENLQQAIEQLKSLS